MISRDDLITEALFSVGGESLTHDFQSNPADRLQIYKIYETSVRYVSLVSKMRLLVKTEDAANNPNLPDGWYFMPSDFVAWYDKKPQALDYQVDSEGQYSVLLYNQEIKFYAFFENITVLDAYFKEAVKWNFLSQLKMSDKSLMPYSQEIELKAMTNLKRLRTNTKFSNIFIGN